MFNSKVDTSSIILSRIRALDEKVDEILKNQAIILKAKPKKAKVEVVKEVVL